MAGRRDWTNGTGWQLQQVIRGREKLPGRSGDILAQREPGPIGPDGRRVISQALADELAAHGLRVGDGSFGDISNGYCPYEIIDASGKTCMTKMTDGSGSTSHDLMSEAGVPVTHAIMHWATPSTSAKGRQYYPRWLVWNRCGERVHAITSLYVGMDLIRLINQIGPPPWEPAVRIRIITMTTQAGREYYRLRVVA